MGARSEQTAERKRTILDAALTLFVEGGADAISIEALGAASGASVGTIYHHFRNKDGVLAALHESLLAEYREAMRHALAAKRSPRSIVKGLVVQHLAWTEARPDAARYLHRMRHSAAVLTEDAAVRERTTSVIRQLRGKLRGHVRELPAPVFVALVVGPADQFARHWLNGRTSGLLPSDVAAELSRAAWAAVEPAER